MLKIIKSCLKPVTNTETYAETHTYNFSVLENLHEDKSFSSLTKTLSSFSGIEEKIIEQTLKRQILLATEHYPERIVFNKKAILKLMYFLGGLCYRAKIFCKHKKYDVLVDDWSLNVRENFYGETLLSKIAKENSITVFDINSIKHVLFQDVPRVFIYLPYLYYLIFSIYYRKGLFLQYGVHSVIRDSMAGRFLARKHGIEVVLSGEVVPNIIRCKAANAKLVSLNNGYSPGNTIYSYFYADIILSLPARKYLASCTVCNYLVGDIRYVGSLRQARFYKKQASEYPLLWISSVQESYFSEKFISLEGEYKATKLINEFAAKYPEVPVYYRFRSDNELEILKEKKLYCEHIHYLSKSSSVYEEISKAEVVMTKSSSTGIEAMGAGKKVGILNFFGNPLIHEGFKNLNIHLFDNSLDAFYKFYIYIRDYDTTRYESYAYQSPNFEEEVVKAIYDARTKQYEFKRVF